MLPDGTGAFFVDFTADMETQAFKADKTHLEVLNAVKSGCVVIARLKIDDYAFLTLTSVGEGVAIFSKLDIVGESGTLITIVHSGYDCTMSVGQFSVNMIS